uniref:Uncharacterized protein n=1 Tax=Aegilops tauschii subsp. strangulata TaxID=200361 RepID=A0A453T7D6_AEGTS
MSLPDLYPSSRVAMLLSRTPGRMRQHRQELAAFMDAIVREHQEVRRADDEEEDLLDVLLRIQREGDLQFPLSTDNIKSAVGDMFAGGSETAATTLQWAMSELVRNPRTMLTAQDEVRLAISLAWVLTHGDRGLPTRSKLPAPGGQGDAPAAPASAPAAATGVPERRLPGPGLRRAQGDHGARQRLGHQQGPDLLGGRGGVRAGEVRVRRGRRLQRRGHGVHTVRGRPADVPRDGVRAGQRGARPRRAAVPLRLGVAGRSGRRGAGHGGGYGRHRAPAQRPCACPRGASARAAKL